MKKTFLVMAMAIALAMSTMAGALAKPGEAPGHKDENGALKGVTTDSGNNQEVEYLFNKAGYHFWFTATESGWGNSSNYDSGDAYHNIYKYQVDNPADWCGTTEVPNRQPYNLGGTVGQTAYYKIWNVTLDEPSCGTFDLASGNATYVPSGDHRTDVQFDVQVSPAGTEGDVAVSNHWQGDKNVNFTGEVTCSEKVGDILYFAGDITSYENVTTSPTKHFYFSIKDGSPDLIRVLRSDAWEGCNYAGTPIRDVVTGELTIH